MEESITEILEGRHVPVDHILNQQSMDGFETLPVTKRNVCYICNSVIFDEEGRVLLVQEAKPSCYGQWYLPAGRLEPGETIIDGAKREVKEEAGLECELTTLLCVELNGTWMRFTFIGVVTGGSLKTLDEKDKESLQAQFFQLTELPKSLRPTKMRDDSKSSTSQCVLRCDDILKLIFMGQKYLEKKSHKECLPVIYPHKYILYRYVIIDKSSTSSMHILATKKGEKLCFPTVIRDIRRSVPALASIASILNAAFSMSPAQCLFQVCGVLSIEHRGTGEAEDGICITYLINMDLGEEKPLPEVAAAAEYSWHAVASTHLKTRLIEGCQRKNVVPII